MLVKDSCYLTQIGVIICSSVVSISPSLKRVRLFLQRVSITGLPVAIKVTGKNLAG
jgi:hypothetical protein